MLPASHFLVSLTTTVRPSFFVALEKVQQLFHDVTAGKLRRTPLEVKNDSILSQGKINFDAKFLIISLFHQVDVNASFAIQFFKFLYLFPLRETFFFIVDRDVDFSSFV